ncbi:MAG: right-handed parallel beta-helix repeat-containing protein [Candidatus Hydrogenedentes bacterium]|nr:right-handed parallel beta-helix repeat-containing protein [Candidatus Hydrogenedentota bacterium]
MSSSTSSVMHSCRAGFAFIALVLAAGAEPVIPIPAPGEFLSNIPYASYIDNSKVPEGRVFDLREFGAVGDGKAINTVAIAKAITAAHDSGGGVVRIDGGDYVSGTIHLKSNVTLYIAKDSVLRASRSGADYDPPHFIYCQGANRVSIAGPGKILGEGDAWWTPPRAAAPTTPPAEFNLKEMESTHFLAKRKKVPNRPSPLIRLQDCTHVKMSNLIVENSPGWTVMLDHCDRVKIDRVILNNNYHGENTDGIDVVGSNDVEITRCFVSTGDDGIVLKNGFAKELSRPMTNVRIANCAIRSGANCIKIGTETWSNISDVRISECELFTEEIWPWGLAAIAIESVDGAHVKNITAENISVRNVNAPLFIRLGNRNRWKDKDRAGALESISIQNMKATGIEFPCVISGIAGMPIKGVMLENIDIRYREAGERLEIVNPVPEVEAQYPEFWMFGDLPAHGLYARHVDGLTVRGFQTSPRRINQRDKFVFDDVQNLNVED